MHPLLINVFHGTRLSTARAIEQHGFQPVPVGNQIAAMATVHDVDVDELLGHMKQTYRFTHSDPRAGVVSLVGDFGRAAGWANRSPEAARDALMSIYRMRHPDPDDESGWRPAPQFWVLAQLNQLDPPAVVTVQAAATALGRTRGREDTAQDLLDRMIASGDRDGFNERFRLTPEWRARPEDMTPISVQVVPVAVDRDVLTYMAGSTREEMGAKIHQGQWGDPGGYDAAGMPWWKFSEVWQRLSSVRQAELEAETGHPLGAIG